MKLYLASLMIAAALFAGCAKKETAPEPAANPAPATEVTAAAEPEPPAAAPVAEPEILHDYFIRISGTEGTPVSGYWMGGGSKPHGQLSVKVPAEVPFQAPDFRGYSLRKMTDEGTVTVELARGDEVLHTQTVSGKDVIITYMAQED